MLFSLILSKKNNKKNKREEGVDGERSTEMPCPLCVEFRGKVLTDPILIEYQHYEILNICNKKINSRC